MVNMELDFREKQRKSYRVMRMIYDLSMAVFILGMAFILLLAEQLKIEQLTMKDPMYRYLMGSISVL